MPSFAMDLHQLDRPTTTTGVTSYHAEHEAIMALYRPRTHFSVSAPLHLLRGATKPHKMGAPRGLRRHAAASACPLLAFAVLLALPGLAAGVTRRYTFNVVLTTSVTSLKTERCMHRYSLTVRAVSSSGGDDERDAAVRHQEHPDGERAVPGAEAGRAGGRPARGHRPQPHEPQRHVPLVRTAVGACTVRMHGAV